MSEQGKVAIFPLLLYCKQPLLGEVYRPALAVSGYEFQTKPSFYISPSHKRFDIIVTSDRLTFFTALGFQLHHNSLHFLDETFFSFLLVILKISSYRFSLQTKAIV